MPHVDIATGARLHYVSLQPKGRARGTVIAVHGFLGTAETNLGRVMRWLQGLGYHVLGPTLRGYGESLPKPRDFPLKFYRRDAEDVLAFMDALAVEKAHFLGYSDGGEVVLTIAGIAPQRAQSAAVWGAVGYFGALMRPYIQRMYPPHWMTEDDCQRHGIAHKEAFVLAWIRAMKYYLDSGGDVSLSLAPRITAPLLMMLGKADKLNPAEYAEVYLERVKHGRLALFDCGHAVHDEQWEAFCAAVEAHLAASV